jgi:hypothetical protein
MSKSNPTLAAPVRPESKSPQVRRRGGPESHPCLPTAVTLGACVSEDVTYRFRRAALTAATTSTIPWPLSKDDVSSGLNGSAP